MNQFEKLFTLNTCLVWKTASVNPKIPVVPHKALAEVSQIGSL